MVKHTAQQHHRRRGLADAATGLRRFTVIVYVSAAPGADTEVVRRECREYAEMYCWHVAEVVEDRTGLLPPQGRDGLAGVIERVRAGDAGAVLTRYRSMISPRPAEYDDVAAEVEKAGGFLIVMEPGRGQEHA